MKTSILFILFSLFALPIFSQVKHLEKDQPPGIGNIEDLDWVVGYWTGTGLGGECDETWMPAVDGSMVGTFRFWQDGKLVFSEFMNLIQEEETFYLKLKHFNPDLSGWEEKEEWTIFPLVSVEKNTIWFHGFTMKRIGDKMVLYLEISENGKTQLVEFNYSKTTL